MEVRVRLLGGFEVETDGRIVAEHHWRRRAAAGVVKVLALQPRRRLHRDQVIDALWPDLLVGDALPRLHKATHYARAALGAKSSVMVDGQALVLWPDAHVHVDVDDFELAVEAARADGGPAAARRAAELYGGDLLPDDLYEAWTDEQRSRLRLWWLEMLPVAGMYEELVAANPLEEEAHLALARWHIGAGRRQPALGALDRLAEVMEHELGVPPSPEAIELRQLAESLQTRTSGVVSPGLHRGLPASRSRLIGREHDLEAVEELLSRHRIVTIAGPGGAGKSTLALAAARAVADSGTHAPDVVFAELATARDADEATRVVAEAAGIEGEGSVDVVALAANLAERGTLMILDNCEHLIEVSARLVNAVLDAGPAARVLATSREPLRVEGEAEHRIGSLGQRAVELFVERAEAVRPGAVTADDPQVAHLCERLDGLPLAIELAAAQLRYLGLPEIVDRLDDRLRLLAGGRARAGERHSALYATIDWSHRLLDNDARELFADLGVFPAGFDLAGVIALGDADPVSVTRLLGDLVDKSLVVYDAEQGRYRLLETVRLFASELLGGGGRREHVVERLRGHIIARARSEPRSRAWLSTSLSASSRDDLDNVRWAFEISLERDDVTAAVDVALGLSTLWRNATSYEEGRRWVAVLERRAATPQDRMWVEILGADIGLGSGNPIEMRSRSDAAVALAGAADDASAEVIASVYQAMVHLGDPAVAVERLVRAERSATEIGEDGLARLARGYRTVALLLLGSTDEARVEGHALTDGPPIRDYAQYLCRWAASLVALIDRDGSWQAELMARQRDDLVATGLRENWLVVYWGALASIGLGDEYMDQLVSARAWARAEGRNADADCVLALAYAAACRDDWERAAELVAATEGALLHDTAGYLHQALIRDRLVRPHLAPDRYGEAAERGRRLSVPGVLDSAVSRPVGGQAGVG